jgi:HSP20 family molecular chaperone IbpA
MYIRLKTITSDDIAGKSLFEHYANYSKRNAPVDYKDHSKTVDEDMGNISANFGIINPYPWRRSPWDEDENQSISWPSTIKKVMEMAPNIRANVIETSDSYIIQADLPGYNEDSIKIYMDDNGELHLNAERKIEKPDGVKFLLEERVSQDIEKTISIPGSVDLENSQAEYKDGVLTIILPKSQIEKNRHIPLKKASQKQLPSE